MASDKVTNELLLVVVLLISQQLSNSLSLSGSNRQWDDTMTWEDYIESCARRTCLIWRASGRSIGVFFLLFFCFMMKKRLSADSWTNRRMSCFFLRYSGKWAALFVIALISKTRLRSYWVEPVDWILLLIPANSSSSILGIVSVSFSFTLSFHLTVYLISSFFVHFSFPRKR